MRHIGLVVFFAAVSIAAASAQGLNAPQQGGVLPPLGGIGGPVPLAPGPTGGAAGNQPMPFGQNGGQPNQTDASGSSTPGRAGPGFGSASQPAPDQPVRQNYADELTDFHVPPQSTLQSNVGSPTPLSIPGGHLITTAEVRQTQGMQALLIDVLAGPPHPTIPGALTWPGAGDFGNFNDEIQQKMWTALSEATHMNPAYPIIFFCAGARCWESYNAALRAANMGFKTVLWYRGGLASWHAAGLPLTGPGQQQAPAGQQGGAPRIGFTQ